MIRHRPAIALPHHAIPVILGPRAQPHRQGRSAQQRVGLPRRRRSRRPWPAPSAPAPGAPVRAFHARAAGRYSSPCSVKISPSDRSAASRSVDRAPRTARGVVERAAARWSSCPRRAARAARRRGGRGRGGGFRRSVAGEQLERRGEIREPADREVRAARFDLRQKPRRDAGAARRAGAASSRARAGRRGCAGRGRQGGGLTSSPGTIIPHFINECTIVP